MASSYDGTVRINTDVDTTGLTNGLNGIDGTIGKLTSKLKGLGKLIAGAFAIKQIISFSKACIELGSDLQEVQNVVDVTFGKMSGAVDEFARNAAEQFGLSELSAKQYSSTIGSMFKSMGIGAGVGTEDITKFMSADMAAQFNATGDAVTDMSLAITELSADMASFYNLDTDTAFQKIRAGISGETEPLKQLGINMSTANLEAFRLAQGMSTAYSAMSQSEQTLLRYQYLLSVTGDAQGDFARTSGSWANQTKVLNLQLQSLKANIGQGLINLLTPALRMINTVLSALTRLASAFKSFTELITGNKATAGSNTAAATADNYSDTAGAISDAADAAGNYADATKDSTKATKAAAKAAKNYESPLDHIHKLQKDSSSDTSTPASSSGSSKGTGASTTAALANSVDYGQLAQGDTVVDKLATKMKAFYDMILTKSEPVRKAAANLWSTLKSGGKWVLDNVLIPLGKWTANEVLPRFFQTLANIMNIFNNVLKALEPLWQWFWDNVLQPIAQFTGDAFLTAWDGINTALGSFAKWCAEHPKTIQNMTIVIGSFFAAWKVTQLITDIKALITTITAISKSVVAVGGGFLKAAFSNPWLLLIAAVIAAVVLIATNWDAVKAYLKRTWETIKRNADQTWTGIKNFFVKTWNLIKTATITTWNAIVSFVNGVWNGIKTAAQVSFNAIKSAINNAWNAIKTVSTNVWNAINSAITGVFNNILNLGIRLKTEIPNAFRAAFGTLKSIITKPINAAIGAINGLVAGVANGINAVISTLNKLHFNIPSWIPGYGGKSFGLNIPSITSYPQIPYLASGAVIPPNAPFTAVLGDQKNGTNLEAPESLIRQIVREESGGSGRYQFIAQLNRRTIFDEIINEAKVRQTATGRNPFEMA